MGSRGRSSNSRGGSFGGSRSGGGSSFGSSRSYSSGRRYSSSNLGFIIGAMLGRDYASQGESVEVKPTNNQPAVKYKKVRNKKATATTCLILGAITIVFIALSICGFNMQYGRVAGTVESVYTRYEYGEKYYYTSYEYVVDGRVYSAESQSGWTLLPDPIDIYIGGQYELYYKKSNPYIIYEIEDKENIPTNKNFYILLAVMFGITTVCIAVAGIGKYEIDKEHLEAQEKLNKQKVPNGKKLCEYCGNISDANKDKCQSCGAPLK